MVLDGVVGRGEERATIKSIQGWDELGTLEERDEGDIVGVGAEGVEESERLRRRFRVTEGHLGRRRGRKKGQKAERNARP